MPYRIVSQQRTVFPFPLLPKVQEELEQMLANGIIEQVSEPTHWCAPMVSVPKTQWKRQNLR